MMPVAPCVACDFMVGEPMLFYPFLLMQCVRSQIVPWVASVVLTDKYLSAVGGLSEN